MTKLTKQKVGVFASVLLLCLIALGFQKIPSPSSVGTSTQVLHGGNTPAFGAVVLTTDVSGVLPAANSTPSAWFAWCDGSVGTGNGVGYVLVPGKSNSTITCNEQASNAVPMPIPYDCLAKNLRVQAGVAGSQATSGKVELYFGGSPTVLTCTLGTGTQCSDLTHSVSLPAGNSWWIQVTTGQASDATSSVKATFQCQ